MKAEKTVRAVRDGVNEYFQNLSSAEIDKEMAASLRTLNWVLGE